jgi:hypothetical protein
MAPISKGLDLGEKIAKAKRQAEQRDKEKSENEAAEASKEAAVFFARAQSDPGSFCVCLVGGLPIQCCVVCV